MNNKIILIGLAVAVASFLVGYVRGFWAGRKDAQEEAALKDRKARRLLVVNTASAFCGEKSAVMTREGFHSQEESAWDFKPRLSGAA